MTVSFALRSRPAISSTRLEGASDAAKPSGCVNPIVWNGMTLIFDGIRRESAMSRLDVPGSVIYAVEEYDLVT